MKVTYLVLCLFLLLQDSGAWIWGSSKMSFTVCKGQKMNLQCMQSQVIKIRHANYGRTSYNVCTRGNLNTDDCESKTAKEIAKKHCNGKRRCKLTASNRIFGNPCRGTSKYLEVTFSCVNRDDDKRNLQEVEN